MENNNAVIHRKTFVRPFYFQNKIHTYNTYTQCLSSACRLKKGTPRSENFRRNTPIIAKIPPKDPITKNPVTSREFGHPCVEVFARVSFEGFKSDASGEWG